MMPRDTRHKGYDPREPFNMHYRIAKLKPEKLCCDHECAHAKPIARPWTLSLHVRMAGWHKVGKYDTQQSAIEAMDDEIRNERYKVV